MLSSRFALKESTAQQMSRLGELRMNDPDRARDIFALGERLIVLAGNGELRKLKEAVEKSAEGDIMVYFVAKMFQESLLKGHLMVASYIIDQGYPFNSSSVPNVLHLCLLHPEVEDFRAAEICDFLRLKGIDIDAQAPKTWLTALHMAVQRCFVNTVRTLVENGADVNAVADDDLLPLTIAERCTPSPAMDEIKALLLGKGARSTWRSAIVYPTPKGSPTNKPAVESGNENVFNNHISTMVSFSGGFKSGGMGIPTIIIPAAGSTTPPPRPVATVTVDSYLPVQELKDSFTGEKNRSSSAATTTATTGNSQGGGNGNGIVYGSACAEPKVSSTLSHSSASASYAPARRTDNGSLGHTQSVFTQTDGTVQDASNVQDNVYVGVSDDNSLMFSTG